MTDKMGFYDLMGMLVPGFLLTILVLVGFPAALTTLTTSGVPDAFLALALTALAVFLGQVVLAIGSIIESVLFWTWGGRPSDRALTVGLGRYLPKDSAVRIRARLVDAVGPGASDHSLFLFAMQKAGVAKPSRVSVFNGLYAYHRSLLTLVLLALVGLVLSRLWGAVSGWSWREVAVAVVTDLLLAALFWYRTKQRACYYVREVLLTAEHVLADRVRSDGAEVLMSQGG